MNKIFKTLNIEQGKTIKLFFRGKPLKDEDLIQSSIEQPNPDNSIEVSVLASNMNNEEEIQEENNREIRGFNRFRQLGMASSEIQLIRILFHTAYSAENRMSNNIHKNIYINIIDPSRLTPEIFLEREERWLNENNPDLINSNPENIGRSENNNHPLRQIRLLSLRPNGYVNRPTLIRTHLFLPRNNEFFGQNGEIESNFRFFLGFFFGSLLTIYSVIFLIFCRFSPKFRVGMILGMIFGTLIFIFYNLLNQRV